MIRLAAVLLLALLTGCLFPTYVDPCPTPISEHPEAWVESPMTDAAGNVVMIAYVCVAAQ